MPKVESVRHGPSAHVVLAQGLIVVIRFGFFRRLIAGVSFDAPEGGGSVDVVWVVIYDRSVAVDAVVSEIGGDPSAYFAGDEVVTIAVYDPVVVVVFGWCPVVVVMVVVLVESGQGLEIIDSITVVEG